MSVGSILFGVGLALVVVAYLVRPFRASQTGGDPDRVIEKWVVRARTEQVSGRGEAESAAEEINYCPQCGRRVAPGDNFCPKCGRPLREEAE